jgi:phage anti-repressor protein
MSNSNIVPSFSFSIAKDLFNSTDEFPVNFDLAWQWLEYDRKDSGKRFLVENLEEGIDFHIFVELGTLAVPRPPEKIFLSIEGFKNWGMMSRTATGRIIRKYFIECEKVAKKALGVAGEKSAWTKARSKGIEARKNYTEVVHSFEPTSKDYAIATNQTYLGMFGKTAAELKIDRGIAPKKSARAGFTKLELIAVELAEASVSEREHRSLTELNRSSFEQAQAISRALSV